MTTLRDLKKALADMSDDDLKDHITQVRAERRMSSRVSAIKKPKDVKIQDVSQIDLDSLSDEELMEMARLFNLEEL